MRSRTFESFAPWLRRCCLFWLHHESMVTCVCNWLREYRSYLAAYIFIAFRTWFWSHLSWLQILEIDARSSFGIDCLETAEMCVHRSYLRDELCLHESQVLVLCSLRSIFGMVSFLVLPRLQENVVRQRLAFSLVTTIIACLKYNNKWWLAWLPYRRRLVCLVCRF